MRKHFSIRFLPAALFLFACTHGSTGQDTLSNGPEPGCQEVTASPLALWSEFLSPEAVLEQVPHLKNHALSLYQDITSDAVDARDPGVARLFQQASCQGLEVRAWLTLPVEEGYWPNEENVDTFAEKAYDLADWIRSEGWSIEWIVVDMEPGYDLMQELFSRIENGDILGALGLLIDSHDSVLYAQSVRKFTRMVETLHGMGFKVMLVTFPLVLDDLKDGDATIQDALNTPVEGIPWDELSFMAYTTVFESVIPNDITPFLIKSYGLDAKAAYGGRAGVDLGVIGEGGMMAGAGITNIQEFRAQVGAAKQAGLTNIHAYSLNGILFLEEGHQQDPQTWFQAFQAESRDVPDQFTVNLLRSVIQLVDQLIRDPDSSRSRWDLQTGVTP
jgi:hypothetical protein